VWVAVGLSGIGVLAATLTGGRRQAEWQPDSALNAAVPEPQAA
jgi:hypothetical protein